MKKESLSTSLKKALQEKEYYRGKYDGLNDEYYALKKQYDNKFAAQISAGYKQAEEILNANRQLMEIVRWHINPETAKIDDKNIRNNMNNF